MQPTREEMIDRIYEVMADKTLSFGCRIQHSNWDIFKTTGVGGWLATNDKIIGHPVMIWDVFDWCMVELWNLRHYWETNKVDDNFRKLLWLRDDFRKPIKKQSDDCITFIYNLVKDATHATSSTINGV